MKKLAWAAAGVLTLTAGLTFVNATGAAAENAADAPSSLVEDFSYPGADTILKDFGLKVFKGDGHITFTTRKSYDDGQCAANEIQVERSLDVEPYGYYYCFKTVGTTGLLTLEVPGTFGVRAGSTDVQAKAKLPEGTKTFEIPAGKPVPIDPGSDNELPKAVLVELRLS
ncbi:hypothetical protein [Actinoplanes sp. NPDC051859]|uniref:hypothetical protein n=1 Tax=Actinoplanes sp. NPDC051859 TaxID=3363909 RepID=UPI00379E8B73